MQETCRTTIEFEPPPNESIRGQEVGRIKRRGNPSSWIRHITLLTDKTLNIKQDADGILKNLPNLLTQLDMEVWGRGKDDQSFELGDFVLFEEKLYPVNDPPVADKGLKPLNPDELLLQISMQLLGRKPEGDIATLQSRVLDNKRGLYEVVVAFIYCHTAWRMSTDILVKWETIEGWSDLVG